VRPLEGWRPARAARAAREGGRGVVLGWDKSRGAARLAFFLPFQVVAHPFKARRGSISRVHPMWLMRGSDLQAH